MGFLRTGCIWIVLDGKFDSVFCKSKDLKAFLRCSCVHFFVFLFCYNNYYYYYYFFFFLFFFALQRKICVPKGSMSFGVGERGRHSFVNRFKTWLCRTTLMFLSPLKDAPLKKLAWRRPLLKRGREGRGRDRTDRTQHAFGITFGQCAVVNLHTLRHLEEKKKKKMSEWWEMPLWPINVQSLFLLYFFVGFYLIRTQAFSVFSEVSGHVAAPQRDRTIHKCQRVWNSNCMNKRDGLWMTLCSFLIVTFFFSSFDCFLNSPQPTEPAEFTSSISLL